MLRTAKPLIPVLLAASALACGLAAGPASAENSNLVLYSQHNGVGDVQTVAVPSQESCVPLESSFQAQSAFNPSGQYNAALYSNGDCSGEPTEVVGKFKKPNFPQRHDIGSVSFTR